MNLTDASCEFPRRKQQTLVGGSWRRWHTRLGPRVSKANYIS